MSKSSNLPHKKIEDVTTKSLRKFIDTLVYVVGVIGPLMTIPQILKIWIEKNAAGISLVSWVGFICTFFVWLTYGVLHKQKPIIITYTLLIITYSLVVIGALIYG